MTTDSQVINLTPSSTIWENGTPDRINSQGYFYYAGTAPCAPILKFTLTPDVNSNGYINFPRNSYTHKGDNKPYNIIKIKSTAEHILTFTTPSIYTAYNQAIEIFRTIGNNVAWEEVRIALRDHVKHWAVRAYAIQVVNSKAQSYTTTSDASLSECKDDMQGFLQGSSTFTINCKTGAATGIFKYMPSPNLTTFKSVEENVGDMIRSNDLIFEDRNYPDSDGYIQHYTADHPEYSYIIYSTAVLSDVSLQYQYLYY